MKFRIIPALLGLSSVAVAQQSTFCPSTDGQICYAVNVPSTSASSGSGDIFFQIKGPVSGADSKSWIALGQGSSMSGSNIFVVYPDSSGTNVTLSPRSGKGHIEPDLDSDTKATLLSGSGVSGGVMTANIKCSNCNQWNGGSMSFTDSKSSWIWASDSGSPIKSDSQSQNIDKHDEMGSFTFDLTQATGGSSANPFVTDTGSSTSPSSGSPSTQPSSGGYSSGSSAGSPYGSLDFVKLGHVRTAHAAVMSLAFLLFFPLGAFIMRLAQHGSTIWIHAGVQIFSYALAIAGMGLGIWMAQTVGYFGTFHAQIGLVVVCVLVLQLPLGLIHHSKYKSQGRRNVSSYIHIWLGRALLTLGVINGGFGLWLSDNSRAGMIAYGVLAGVIYVAYYATIAATIGRKGATRLDDQAEKRRRGEIGSEAS